MPGSGRRKGAWSAARSAACPAACPAAARRRLRAAPLVGSSQLASAGIRVTATSSDRMTETDIATAMSRNSWPTSSSSTRMGMNTITVVRADTRTAPQTWLAPS